MIRLLREFRLIPIVLIATGALFALKMFGLLLDGGYLLGSRSLRNDNPTISLAPSTQMLESPTVTLNGQPSGERPSWMREIFGYPEVTGSVNSGGANAKKNPVNVTGSASAAKPAAKDAATAD